MLDIINRHKGLSIVLGLSLILFIIMLIIFISLFFGNGEGKYGNRLEGIEEVELNSSFLKEIETKLEEDEGVVSATVRLQGKIVYINYELNSDVSIDTAKEIAVTTLDSFSEEELSFYDYSYLVKWIIENEEGKEETKAIAGTKHHANENIVWSKN